MKTEQLTGIFRKQIDTAAESHRSIWQLAADLIAKAEELSANGFDLEDVISVLHSLWDSVVVPIDWKYIPNAIEERVELGLWSLIAQSIRRMKQTPAA